MDKATSVISSEKWRVTNYTTTDFIAFTRPCKTLRTFVRFTRLLADGTTYPYKGTFFVTDREVNVQTGAIRLAGLFPNPGNVLRPGQYGRVRAVTSQRVGALLVPQRAVTELQGRSQVAVVTEANTIDMRTVKVGERVGPLWVIEAGVHPGERVVVEGLQKVRPGMALHPTPFVAAPRKTGGD